VPNSGTRSASPRRVAQPSTTYEPGDPTTVLYGIVRDHFETFRTHAASLRDGDRLPKFVEQARGPLPRGTEALAACELRPDGWVLVAFGPLVSRLAAISFQCFPGHTVVFSEYAMVTWRSLEARGADDLACRDIAV